jgi:hypothetical protein
MSDRLHIPKGVDPNQSLEAHARTRAMELGKLGAFFGSDPAPAVVSIVTLAAMATILVVVLTRTVAEALEIGSKLLLPIITGGFGFLLGKHSRAN